MTPVPRFRSIAPVAGLACIVGLASACGSGHNRSSVPSASAAQSAQDASASAKTSNRPDSGVGPASKPLPDDWPTYHRGGYRAGWGSTVPAPKGALSKIWDVHLDGAVYASPIVAHGYTILATEHNTVYRVAANKVVWSRHFGAPVPQSELPCGNIDPSGITGTPTYDAATSTVAVVALLDNPIRHVAYGIDPQTGAVRWSRNVDVPASVPGIAPRAMQQRGALLVSGRHVYIAYGGLAGDCSSYRGSVVGVDLDHPTSAALTHFTVPTSREGGIWAPPGPVASTQGGFLVAVGNGATAESGKYDFSDSILRIVNSRIVDSFSPSTWRTDNRDDLDLGSQGPTSIGKWVFIAGKRGTAYVLRADHLGGIGGQVSQMPLCRSFGGTAVTTGRVYVPCTDGVRAVSISSTGQMKVLWHAPSNINGSPVYGGRRLWTMDTAAGVLYALNPDTGQQLGHWTIGPVTRFTTPALWRNTVTVATTGGVVRLSWSF